MQHRTIEPLVLEDCAKFALLFQQIGWHKPISLFEQYLKEQNAGKKNVLVIKHKNDLLGYVTIQWESEYPFFKQRHIPEIKDFNILPAYQRQGFGSALLHYAEQLISQHSKRAGIGVGLTPDYGAAQILYIKSGYIPNGEGITQNLQTLVIGSKITVDDDTVLWLTKELYL